MIKRWGTQQATAVLRRDLCEIGLDRRRRMEYCGFLHGELKIRLAQRVLELQSLPHALPERGGIKDVVDWCQSFALDLAASEAPATPQEAEEFTRQLARFLTQHTRIIQSVAVGVQGLMGELGADYAAVEPQVDDVLQRFFLGYIGIRFLIRHLVESSESREGFAGVLELDCDPAATCRRAARVSATLCMDHLGQAPRILVHEEPAGNGVSFCYEPMHLQYMVTEILKNACRAVVEHHGYGAAVELPAVRCRVTYGQEDVSIQISDEGGGIPRSRMGEVWRFMHTTVKRSPWDLLPNPGDYGQQFRPGGGGVLAGYGVGLSLTRLYARYLGGDIRVLSMEGFGTDVYLHLSRLGASGESLPRVVNSGHSAHAAAFQSTEDERPEPLLISHDEAAFLRRELDGMRWGDAAAMRGA